MAGSMPVPKRVPAHATSLCAARLRNVSAALGYLRTSVVNGSNSALRRGPWGTAWT